MDEFKNKVVVITGAASGIGEACTKYFANEKAKVIALDFQQEKVNLLAKSLVQMGLQVLGHGVDVSQKNQIEAAINESVHRFGEIDYWVNAAGISRILPFLETTEKIWDDTLNINLKGQFLCCQVAIKHMLNKGKGVIVNFASQSGKKGTNSYAAYCASKAGVIALTQSIAKEFGAYHIRCNDICPGVVYTPMWEKQVADYAKKKGIACKDVVPNFIKDIPLKRLATLEDVTNLVAFLLSEKSSYMTGQSLNLTGGSWMW